MFPGLQGRVMFACLSHANALELVFSFSLSPGSVSSPKLRQLLLESQSQLDTAKSEAQKQSNELALVSVCVCVNWPIMLHPIKGNAAWWGAVYVDPALEAGFHGLCRRGFKLAGSCQDQCSLSSLSLQGKALGAQGWG